jgi:hypothetical protein
VTDKFSQQDEEIIRQLRELNRLTADYPADSFKKRRASFVNPSNGLILGIPVVGFLKSRFSFLAHVPAKSLEIMLVSVLVAEVGLSTYLFRNQIKDWLTADNTPQIVTLSAPLVQPSLTSSLTSSPTATLTPTATASPALPTNTPNPPPTDQGLHLGQTKTPKP